MAEPIEMPLESWLQETMYYMGFKIGRNHSKSRGVTR